MIIYDFLSSETSHINFLTKEENEIILDIEKYSKIEKIKLEDIKYLIYNSYIYNKIGVLEYIKKEFQFFYDKILNLDLGLELVIEYSLNKQKVKV